MKRAGGLKRFSSTLLMAAVLFFAVSLSAHAIPSLQLDIDGGYYDFTTQTIVTQNDTFTLYAYLIPDDKATLGDTYYISAAVPDVGGGSIGSFDFDGTTVNVTGDMTYGTAPLETYLIMQGWDANDLPKHGIYPSYFKEFAFTFDPANQINPYNTQDRAISGDPISLSGSGMYYAAFTIDSSMLDATYGLHFDLYSKYVNGSGDIDVNQFAPFSHDAERIPEPSVIMLLGAGIVLTHLLYMFSRRRRSVVLRKKR